eukprot:UN01795
MAMRINGTMQAKKSEVSSTQTNSNYELIEENVTDVEWHSRQTLFKRIIFIAIIIIAIISGIIIMSYLLTYEQDKLKPNNDNNVLKCPLSPAYPQSGGAGCSKPCADNLTSASLNFEYHWSQHFMDQIHNASIEMQQYITDLGLNVTQSIFNIDERDSSVHLTLNYFCCLSHNQLEIVNNITANYVWPKMEITFQNVICFDDGSFMLNRYPNNTYIEIVVLATDSSQAILLGAVTAFEQRLQHHGIPINVPRRDNVGFHVTIGFVNGTQLIVPQLVDKLNIIHWNDQSIIINSQRICTIKKNPINHVNYSCLT